MAHRVDTDDLGSFNILFDSLLASLDLHYARDRRSSFASGTRQLIQSRPVSSLTQPKHIRGNRTGGDDFPASLHARCQLYPSPRDFPIALDTRAQVTTGLDLTEGNSFNELVNQPSLFATTYSSSNQETRAKLSVGENQPRTAARHGCARDDLLADQALIRDWIIQLAPESYQSTWTTFDLALADGAALDDFDGDRVEWSLSRSRSRTITVNESGTTSGQFEINPATAD